MKTHCVRADSSQALTSDIRSFVFLTDSSESQGSRIPYLLCILSVKSSWIFLLFPMRKFLSQFLIKGKIRGTLLVNIIPGWCSEVMTVPTAADWIYSIRTACSDHLIYAVKAPDVFVLWGSAKEISGLRNRKTEVQKVFWMRLSEEGDREFWWLWNEFRKIGTWESASGFTAGSVRAYAS